MAKDDNKISIQPHWYAKRKNLHVFHDPDSGRPLIATFEMHSDTPVDIHRTIPGTLLTGFTIPLDREDVPPLIAGTIVKAVDIPMYGIRSWFGCHLYPGVFTQVFGIPNNELPPEGIFMDDLINTGTLAEEIRSASNQQEREIIAFRFIMDHLMEHQRADFQSLPFYLADRILSSGGTLSVSELAQETAFSARYLQNKMQENLGISPKMAIDNVRLQKALHLLLTTDMDLAQIAQECGYYDQAHFVHSFHKTVGCAPRQFARGELKKPSGNK